MTAPRSSILVSVAVVLAVICEPVRCFAEVAPKRAGSVSAGPSVPARTFVATQGWVCLVSAQGELFCKLLGRNEGRQNHDMQYRLPSFERVAGVSDVLEIDAHGKYLCALDKRGVVQCWGCPTERDCKLWPSAIALPERAEHIAVSAEGACAVLRSGQVQCWGADQRAASPEQTRWYENARPVSLPQDIQQLSATARGYCALHASGGVSCWGGCSGADCRALPVTRIAGINGASAIATGLAFGCAVVGPAREVQCWGLSEPALHDASAGKPTFALQPVTRIAGLQRVKQLAAGHVFVVAIADDGSVFHWGGYNEPGIRQLGRRQPSEPTNQRKPLLVDLQPARIAASGRQVIVGNNYICLETERAELVCDQALARTKPFNIREVWPHARFELPQ